MKLKELICLFLFLSLLNNYLPAQDKANIKFGKIAVADFDVSNYKFDTSAAAVIIADIGESHYEKDNLRGLRLFFTHYRRVKILNKNGVDIATVSIPLYSKNYNGQELSNLKANTYNLENGQVSTIKLDDKSIFTENFAKDIFLKKFTLPAVKEGSIIEYSYTTESSIQLELQPWSFQGKYPCLWSEYSASIPETYDYVILQQGYNPYYISNKENFDTEYGLRVTQHHWVMKDIPSLKEENYTSTINNYISKIEFQLSSIGATMILSNWTRIAEQLMTSENFGADITKNNNWMDDDLKIITQNTSGKLEKAKKIYAFVRDNFQCTQHETARTNNPLKAIFKNKSGNEAEINLLMAAMLNHEDIHSDPVILSTRSHGFANEIYPLMNRYNYVICDAIIDSSTYFLDASREFLSFNHLPQYCYNGQARIIDKENPMPVYFVADSLKESKLTSVFITNDEKQPQDITGSFQSNLGYYESYKLREKLVKKTEKGFFKDIGSSYNAETEIQNAGIDSLKQPDYPITVHFDFSLKNSFTDDIVYFNPMMWEAQKETPFKSAERKYPVEMPYTTDETYMLNMEIPKGYVVDELPKPVKVSLNETDGFFEYIIEKDDNNIQMRSRVKLTKATFQPDDYNSLRDFFAYIVKKQSEQIVFKKKK